MSGIRGGDTKPELLVRSFLHRAGLRFRVQVRSLPGRPDIVLRRHRTVVLVHGCFWHRHPGCRYATTPATNRAFWRIKFAENVARDTLKLRELRKLGWRPLVVWECQLSPKRLALLVHRITRLPRTH